MTITNSLFIDNFYNELRNSENVEFYDVDDCVCIFSLSSCDSLTTKNLVDNTSSTVSDAVYSDNITIGNTNGDKVFQFAYNSYCNTDLNSITYDNANGTFYFEFNS